MMNEYYDSLKILLQKSLQTTKNDQIVILYDESFFPYFDQFLKVIIDTELQATFINFPIYYQKSLIELYKKDEEENFEISLPAGISASIAEATVLLNLLNGQLVTTPVRRSVLQQERTRECRLAHIPGISDEILKITGESPFEEILELSELIAWALGSATHAELKTKGEYNEIYTLEIKLDGWDNEPLMSPGIFYKGSWGNIPPGETFICPNSKNVSGEICIDGSVPDYVLKKNEKITLTFEQGKLVKWLPESDSKAAKFFEEQQEQAQINNDINWNTFAELGIGLNPSIKSLTGNSLFDEKMYGTIHIAIGDNTGFGHNVKSSIHADLVSKNPTLILDNREIISSGHLLKDKVLEWKNNLKFQPLNLSHQDKISVKYPRMEIIDKCIVRRLKRAGRVGYVKILGNEMCVASSELVKWLPDGETRVYKDLLNRCSDKSQLNKLLEILYHYKIIEITKV
jgi:hypothetical protein